MTIQEFRAFLEGMDVKGAPTPEQWVKIKDRIEQLEALRFDAPPCHPVYPTVPQYAPRWEDNYPHFTVTC